MFALCSGLTLWIVCFVLTTKCTHDFGKVLPGCICVVGKTHGCLDHKPACPNVVWPCEHRGSIAALRGITWALQMARQTQTLVIEHLFHSFACMSGTQFQGYGACAQLCQAFTHTHTHIACHAHRAHPAHACVIETATCLYCTRVGSGCARALFS